ncbi:MAG TPA: hypothetical protein VHD33_03310 [Legionellaceae bacterium]|nr:hypothetical protein [Legionellaceae bacterium]
MKKNILALSLVALAATAEAGTMGPVAYNPHFVPFFSGEASHNWYQLMNDPLGVNTTTTNGWGGRAAAGLINQIRENFGLSLEAGYGYYGKITSNESGTVSTSLVTASGSASAVNQILGADVLAGLIYSFNQYDLFLKGGFMVESSWVNATASGSASLLGTALGGYQIARTTSTAALPEIKVGGNYNLNENWGLTVSYMHVFGANSTGSTGSFSTLTDISGSVNAQPPTMNSILFGAYYKFV